MSTNRRNFLAATGAGAAAFGFFPGVSAFGGDAPKESSNEQPVIGYIGASNRRSRRGSLTSR